MVPDYSRYANSKSEEKLKSADILTEACQFLDKLVCLNRIRHHPLKASQTHRLPAMARLCGRQWQQFYCFNTNAHRRQPADYQRWHARKPQRKRCLSCAISECAYNNVNDTLEGALYSAELFIRTVRTPNGIAKQLERQTGNFCSLQPVPSGDGWCGSHIKSKQPPCTDGCLVAVRDSTPFSAS